MNFLSTTERLMIYTGVYDGDPLRCLQSMTRELLAFSCVLKCIPEDIKPLILLVLEQIVALDLTLHLNSL